MSYDRYTKREIREKFPDIYRIVIQHFRKYPQLRGQIQLSGMTIKSLQKVAPDVLEDLRDTAKKNQMIFTGTYYSEPVNACIDGETDLACAWLGTEIVKKEVDVPSGFFPQEQSYHPQLPWILTQLGLSWITVFDPKIKQFKPYKLKGLDGTEIVGIPSISFRRTQDLEELYDQAEDKFLYTFVGDLEKPPDLEKVVTKVTLMNKKGKRTEFITIPEYLKRFGVHGRKYYSLCSWTDKMESPDFARWVSDPQDIEVHHFTNEAMVAIKHARIAKSIIQKMYGENIDCDFKQTKTNLIEDPSTYDIEKACEFLDVEEKYLSHSEKVNILSKAEHLLLWGVNSDARGWTPLIERRRERINSFINAKILCEEIIYRAIRKLVKRIKFQGLGQTERIILLFNPSNKRKYDLEFRSNQPYAVYDWQEEKLLAVNYLQGGKWITQTNVLLPAYGYTTIYLSQTSNWSKMDFHQGTVIRNENLELKLKRENVVISTVAHKFRIGLDPFTIREVIRGMPVHRYTPINPSQSMAQVREGLYPQLRIYKQLDWGIHCTALYTLKDKDILCEYEFDFTKPTFIGPAGNRVWGPIGWDPRGLIVSVETDEAGDIYYDTPYATCKHKNRELSFVTALRFALLQTQQRGVAVIAQSGSQSFKSHGKKGEVGICLGSSTIGGPAEPAWCDIIPEQKQVIHHERFEEEVFFGKYKHSFVVHPYEGDWRKENIPSLAREQIEKAYLYTVPIIQENQGSEPMEQSFLELSPSNLELTNIFLDKEGKLKARFHETQGEETKAELRIGRKIYQKDVAPNAITMIVIE